MYLLNFQMMIKARLVYSSFLKYGQSQILSDITLKLTEKFKNEMQKGNGLNAQEIKIEKSIFLLHKFILLILNRTISKEIETNTCGICYVISFIDKTKFFIIYKGINASPRKFTYSAFSLWAYILVNFIESPTKFLNKSNKCLKDHTKKNGSKSCPFCRKIVIKINYKD